MALADFNFSHCLVYSAFYERKKLSARMRPADSSHLMAGDSVLRNSIFGSSRVLLNAKERDSMSVSLLGPCSSSL